MNKKQKAAQKEEIKYHIINSIIAGGLVFFGAFVGADYNISAHGLIGAICASVIVGLNKFKTYWSTQEKEYRTNKLVAFV